MIPCDEKVAPLTASTFNACACSMVLPFHFVSNGFTCSKIRVFQHSSMPSPAPPCRLLYICPTAQHRYILRCLCPVRWCLSPCTIVKRAHCVYLCSLHAVGKQRFLCCRPHTFPSPWMDCHPSAQTYRWQALKSVVVSSSFVCLILSDVIFNLIRYSSTKIEVCLYFSFLVRCCPQTIKQR